MLIVCPSCVSTYKLPDGVLRAHASVRCAQCGSAFDHEAAQASSDISERVSSTVSWKAARPSFIGEMTFRPSSPSFEGPDGVHVSRFAVLATAVLAVIGLNMAVVAWRQQVVVAYPGLAPVFAAIGLPTGPVLRLDEVETELGVAGADDGLSVYGRIVNAGSSPTILPNLRLVVRDGAQQAIYSWTAPAPQSRLGPGETVAFHSRLATPPAAGHDVVVSFASSVDMASVERTALEP